MQAETRKRPTPPDGFVTAENCRKRDLGEFLKAKRSSIKPSDVGLMTTGRRRTPGLRREEIAQIAGVGATWYTWLEQGRDINVSADVLHRLASALQLSSHETAYVFSLAGHATPKTNSAGRQLNEGVQSVLDGYAGPAFVYDGVFNVVAFNRVADFIYRFDDFVGPRARNMIWRNFMDPYRKRLYVRPHEMAEYVVGYTRGLYSSPDHHRELPQLIDELQSASSEFKQLWDASAKRGPRSYAPFVIVFRLSQLGELTFLPIRFILPGLEDWGAIFLTSLNEKTTLATRQIAAMLARSS